MAWSLMRTETFDLRESRRNPSVFICGMVSQEVPVGDQNRSFGEMVSDVNNWAKLLWAYGQIEKKRRNRFISNSIYPWF